LSFPGMTSLLAKSKQIIVRTFQMLFSQFTLTTKKIIAYHL